MIKNYMTYPLKNMRITQSYYGDTSHRKHWDNGADYKDYPIDDGGENRGKEAIYCPCDEMVVTAVKGVGNSATNTVWLVSTSKVVTPTFEDIAFMTLTHANDEDLKKVTVGRKFKRGEVICHEGTDGASANHIHITCGRGSSNTWIKNSNSSWVILGNAKKPEDVFYLDRRFTKEIWGGYLPWIDLPNQKIGTPVPRDTLKNQIEILIDNLNARSGPSTTSEKLGYVTKGIYDYKEVINQDGYSWYKIENFYIAYQEEWEKVYLKEELNDNNQEEIISSPKFIFHCKKTGKYIITLNEGEELYLLPKQK